MTRRPPPGRPPGETIVLPRRPNLLLGSLTPEELRQLEHSLRPTEYQFEQVIHQPGEQIEGAFFPESGMFSSTITMEDGRTVETGGTGHEGFIGIPLFYGSTESLAVVSCEVPGGGRLLPVDIFRRELNKRGAFYHAVARFTLAVSGQAMQLAACNRLHNVEQRLARWLLMTHDRAGADRFPLTQNFISFMLGVHRPSVTPIAGAFQKAGLIDYGRGVISILDRAGLEDSACECYGAIARMFGELKPQVNG